MRWTGFILLTLFSLVMRAQPGWFVTGMETYRLDNGMEVVLLEDTTQRDVYVSLYASYTPVSSKYYAGVDRVFATLAGGRVLMDSVFARTLICNPQGLDSTLRFLRTQVFERKFGQQEVRQVVNQLRGGRDDIFDRIPRLVYYPREYPLNYRVSEYLQAQDVMDFRYRFNGRRITLILAGNLPDSTKKIIDTVLATVKLQTHEFLPVKKRRKHPGGVYFVNTGDSLLYTGFVKGFDMDAPLDFIKYRLWAETLKQVYPGGKVVLSFSALGSYIGFYFRSEDLARGVKDISSRLSGPLKGLTATQIGVVGNNMARWLDSVMSTPWGFEDMVYYVIKSGRKPAYLSQLRMTFQKLGPSTLKSLLPAETHKDYTPVIIGNELLVGCELLKLSAGYDISFTDAKLHRYKVLRKGFNAWTVIDRYTRFVSAGKPVKNLYYQFEGVFFTDSVFFYLDGYVWKKWPNLYRYETFVRTGSDTLFHHLLIYDGHQWIDSTVVGSVLLDSTQARINQQKSYILGEKFYRQLGYQPEIICEPDLIAANMYKIRVRAGGVEFYEVYDMSTRTKLSTVVRGEGCWDRSYYYYDYRRVQDGKIDFKIPFVVVEQTPYYTLTQRLTDVDFGRISRRVFDREYVFWPGGHRRPGLLFYISRGFDKIKKLCIF